MRKILKIYQNNNGKEPFIDWLESIRDKTVRNRIITRLDRLEVGHPGDCKSIGKSVSELRLHFGSGYRIYFAEVDNTVILLLIGGNKSSQKKDIEKAISYWKSYKEAKS